MQAVTSAAPTFARDTWLRVRPLLPLAAGAVVLLALSWSSYALEPSYGLDPSWTGSIYMATHAGLDYGTQFVWTYGPLGFLKIPQMWDSGLAPLAIVYRAVIRLAYIVVVLRLARGWLGLIGSALLIVLTLALLDDVMPALAFALGMLFVRERGERRLDAWAALAGALAAIELLGKTNTGITVTGLVLIGILVPRPGRWRLLAVFAAAGLATGLIALIATGNPLSTLPDLVHNTGRIISGFSSTMMLDDPTRVWEYSAALVVVAIGLYVAASANSWATVNSRIAMSLMWLLLSFTMFKQGFVRHDGGHSPIFFATMLSAMPLLPWRREQRAFGLMACALPAVVVMAISNLKLTDVISPSKHLSAASKSLHAVVSSGERDKIQQRGRDFIRANEGLSPRLVGLIGRHTVHAFPTETAAIWAYRLNWRPLPVPQTYQAYTQGLDLLDADFLKSARAPERILFQVGGFLDGRILAYDSPATTLALLCRYSVIGREGNWAVLARGENRCGKPRLILREPSGYGAKADIADAPARGSSFVIAKVAGAQVQGLERLRSTLYKAHERHLTLDDTDPHRMVPGTAGDGLLVRATPGTDLPAPFSLVPQPRTMRIDRAGDNKGPLRYDFYVIPVRKPPPAATS